jgi:hypothetical protein
MKLFENPKLDRISTALCMNTADCKIRGRVESYSCKMTKAEKKIRKQISHQDSNPGVQALSPPQPYGSPLAYPLHGSPLAPVYVRMPSCTSTTSTTLSEPHMCDTISTATLLYLRQTLNLSFHPDYDFSNAKSEEFSREPDLKVVMEAVQSKLSGAARERFSHVEGQLWAVVDEVIQLGDCEIYSYNPDLDSDPYCEDGSLWSFNYFFFNKKENKMVFFTCCATSYLADTDSLSESDCEDLEEDMQFDFAT